jgi:hypothetical protein
VAIFRRKQPTVDVQLLSASRRFETSVEGVTSWHCLSTGEHEGPERIAYGSLTGLDEHLVEPGAGFDWRPARGVEVVSWVLDGVMRHEDESGHVDELGPGEGLHQSVGSQTRLRECNPSGTATVRLVQLTVSGGTTEPHCERVTPPVLIPGCGLFDVLPGKTILELGSAWLYVTHGAFNTTGLYLSPGDSVRVGATVQVFGTGELLVWANLA